MILFKPSMVEPICAGTKTVTRRQGKARWIVGHTHLCYTRPAFARPAGRPFARVRIERVEREVVPGGPYSTVRYASLLRHREAVLEGFECWRDFVTTYVAINGAAAWAEPCWRVEFKLLEVLDG